nr:MAG TPA: hypothetical protein [Caudoviricetes sp.]
MITYIIKIFNKWLNSISYEYKSVSAGSSIKSLYKIYRKD